MSDTLETLSHIAATGAVETRFRLAVDLAMMFERAPLGEPAFIDDEDAALQRMLRRHRREDALPRDRFLVMRDILDASGVRDYDSAESDRRYAEWKHGGRKGAKPMGNLGGLLDAFDVTRNGRRLSCVLEGWESETRKCHTWRDVVDVLPVLAEAIGVESLSLPDDVVTRHIAQDVELNGGCDAE